MARDRHVQNHQYFKVNFQSLGTVVFWCFWMVFLKIASKNFFTIFHVTKMTFFGKFLENRLLNRLRMFSQAGNLFQTILRKFSFSTYSFFIDRFLFEVNLRLKRSVDTVSQGRKMVYIEFIEILCIIWSWFLIWQPKR